MWTEAPIAMRLGSSYVVVGTSLALENIGEPAQLLSVV
jgi:hypothetical protein